jgi:hypothetical protein
MSVDKIRFSSCHRSQLSPVAVVVQPLIHGRQCLAGYAQIPRHPDGEVDPATASAPVDGTPVGEVDIP